MGGSLGTSLHPARVLKARLNRATRPNLQFAEAFSPHTMAAADAGDKRQTDPAECDSILRRAFALRAQ